MKLDMDKYEDFTGTLVNIRKIFLRRNLHYLYLANEEKQIRVKCGFGDLYTIGQKMRIGHIGEQIINIRPLSHSPYSKVINKESYLCNLHGKKIRADECADTQEIRRKPGEVERNCTFDLEAANSCCPNCSYNQSR